MKILVITSRELTGLNYHRQLVPHKHLSVNYPEYQISYAENVDLVDLKEYRIVSFLRIISTNEDQLTIVNKCRSAGCVTILDIDDYWELPKTHGLHGVYAENRISELTIESLRLVDYVTTTTSHFADKIEQYNKDVFVIPNSICSEEAQFKTSPIESNRVRIGWIGGVHHLPDIKMLYEGFGDVWKYINNDKFQMCVGGYNYPNKLQYVNEVLATGKMDATTRSHFELYQRNLQNNIDVPNVLIFNNAFGNIPQYDLIEFYFTCGNKYPKDKDYQQYLDKKVQNESELMNDKPYKRLWGKSANDYAAMYNEIDVALVPLQENSFNSFKSQIKIIEAGWFKKAVIVSNVMPYTIDCNKNNSILISPSKRNEGWGAAMKSLILNENKRLDLAEAMHEHVKENYNMDKVNLVRNQLYKSICV